MTRAESQSLCSSYLATVKCALIALTRKTIRSVEVATNVNDLLARVQRVNKAIEQAKIRNAELRKEVDMHQQTLTALAAECMEKYGIEPDQIPAKVDELMAQFEREVVEAEQTLGIQPTGAKK